MVFSLWQSFVVTGWPTHARGDLEPIQYDSGVDCFLVKTDHQHQDCKGCSATLIAGFAHRFRPATFRRNMVNIDQTDVCSEFMLVSFIIHPLLLDGQKRGFCVGLL
jgi:hypothetical protein